MDDLLKDLANEMNNKNIKVTFGIQPTHIEVINRVMSAWDGAIYSEGMWQIVGKEIGWHPFTIALHYFQFLNDHQNFKLWISTDDFPLFEKEVFGWVCTEAGNGEFMAAVNYRDKRKPNEDLWWVHHCVIEDEIGLCVVGEDENTPAGWTMEDVLFYFPIPKPPLPEPPKEK